MKIVSLLLSAFAIAACTAEPVNPPEEDRGDPGKADSYQWGSCAADDGAACGGRSEGTCYCDDECATFHDCCDDAAVACGVPSNRLDDRTAGKTALLGAGDLQIAANLPYPPGNVAIAPNGRVFISFFDDGNQGDFATAELVGGNAVAFPSSPAFQDRLDAVLGVRADRQGRLWLLDHGTAGLSRPEIFAIDIATQTVVFEHRFTSSEAGLGSLLNDVVIAPAGDFVYITDLSPLARKPAIVTIDLRGPVPVVRRRLERHASVVNGPYDTFVNGYEMRIKGIRPTQGVDGLALDAAGANLYYAALNGGELYRVPTAALRDGTDAALAAAVQKVADITMTDGMIADTAGNIYLTDMEHSAIARVTPAGELEVVVKDDRLRWPDGFAWAPDGSLYVTASALHTFLPKLIVTEQHIAANAPYHVFRLAPPL
jgi:sugar lactone lactonase YvrE